MTEEKTNRRDFLKYITNSVAFVASGITITAILGFIFPYSFGKKKRSERLVLSDTDFPENKNFLQTKIGTRDILLIRKNTTIRAFDLQCTHAGCTTQWQESRKKFFCACHNGLFDHNGKPISGPPKKPLKELIVFREESAIIVTEQTKN